MKMMLTFALFLYLAAIGRGGEQPHQVISQALDLDQPSPTRAAAPLPAPAAILGIVAEVAVSGVGNRSTLRLHRTLHASGPTVY